ncbi:hypothetical protein ACQY0O_005472 [Thecaphora frezii]
MAERSARSEASRPSTLWLVDSQHPHPLDLFKFAALSCSDGSLDALATDGDRLNAPKLGCVSVNSNADAKPHSSVTARTTSPQSVAISAPNRSVGRVVRSGTKSEAGPLTPLPKAKALTIRLRSHTVATQNPANTHSMLPSGLDGVGQSPLLGHFLAPSSAPPYTREVTSPAASPASDGVSSKVSVPPFGAARHELQRAELERSRVGVPPTLMASKGWRAPWATRLQNEARIRQKPWRLGDLGSWLLLKTTGKLVASTRHDVDGVSARDAFWPGWCGAEMLMTSFDADDVAQDEDAWQRRRSSDTSTCSLSLFTALDEPKSNATPAVPTRPRAFTVAGSHFPTPPEREVHVAKSWKGLGEALASASSSSCSDVANKWVPPAEWQVAETPPPPGAPRRRLFLHLFGGGGGGVRRGDGATTPSSGTEDGREREHNRLELTANTTVNAAATTVAALKKRCKADGSAAARRWMLIVTGLPPQSHPLSPLPNGHGNGQEHGRGMVVWEWAVESFEEMVKWRRRIEEQLSKLEPDATTTTMYASLTSASLASGDFSDAGGKGGVQGTAML